MDESYPSQLTLVAKNLTNHFNLPFSYFENPYLRNISQNQLNRLTRYLVEYSSAEEIFLPTKYTGPVFYLLKKLSWLESFNPPDVPYRKSCPTARNTGNYFTLELFELVMEPHGAYGRIRLFLEDLTLVLGYLPPPTTRPYTNFNFNSLGLQQNSWKRPTHRSRVWKQNRRGNGQERPWDARHPPPHASPTKQSKIHSVSNACVRLPPRQLPNNNVHHQHERCYLGGMGPSTIQLRSNTQQIGDFQSISKHDVDQIGQPQGDCLGFDLDAPVEIASNLKMSVGC
ncbi:hypothetical protein H4Q26_002138 [Puccinia striiformis f. sp. tritici PST-130]|nr:hypothetical protein H4Q26_002138 [Puccinia striiformis f. sp. tritici PST-130]